MDAANVDFFHLNENVVTPPTPSSTIAGAAADTMVRAIAFNGINPPTFPTATYALEGEMTYNGNRFYPDGELMADFANDRIGGEISLDGAEAADDFGGTTFADGTTTITNSDNLTLGLGDVSDAANSGDILNDDLGFSGALNIITAEGFFASLSGTGDYRGRFNDAADYVGGNAATAAPQEISGIFGGITDANGNEFKRRLSRPMFRRLQIAHYRRIVVHHHHRPRTQRTDRLGDNFRYRRPDRRIRCGY